MFQSSTILFCLPLLISVEFKQDLVPSNMFKPSSICFTGRYKAAFLLWILFVICVSSHNVLSVPCSLVITCGERADLLALLYAMFSCVFTTFPCGVLGRVST